MNYPGRRKRSGGGSYDQNDGIAGVVYILRNEAFKDGWIKIGQTRHSGHVRAMSMNKEASTGLPAHHICVFECRTLDCGNAEKAVFRALQAYRKGRQEFFEIDFEFAKTVITKECATVDSSVAAERAKEKLQEQDRLCEEQKITSATQRDPIPAADSIKNKATVQIDLTCPKCATSLTADVLLDTAIQKIRCPKCAYIFSRGEASQPSTSAAPHPTPSKETALKKPGHLRPAIIGLMVIFFGTYAINTLNSLDRHESYPASQVHSPQSPATALVKAESAPIVSPSVVVQPVPVPESVSHLMPSPYLSRQIKVANEAANRTPSEWQQRETQLQADMKKATDRAIARYPYLNTPDGAYALERIHEKRDQLIQKGVYPSLALTQAVNAFADAYDPK